MSQIDKIIEKMQRQPNGIRIEKAERVLNAYGYVVDILNRINQQEVKR